MRLLSIKPKRQLKPVFRVSDPDMSVYRDHDCNHRSWHESENTIQHDIIEFLQSGHTFSTEDIDLFGSPSPKLVEPNLLDYQINPYKYEFLITDHNKIVPLHPFDWAMKELNEGRDVSNVAWIADGHYLTLEMEMIYTVKSISNVKFEQNYILVPGEYSKTIWFEKRHLRTITPPQPESAKWMTQMLVLGHRVSRLSWPDTWRIYRVPQTDTLPKTMLEHEEIVDGKLTLVTTEFYLSPDDVTGNDWILYIT